MEKKLVHEIEMLGSYSDIERMEEIYKQINKTGSAKLKKSLAEAYVSIVEAVWLDAMSKKFQPPESGYDFALQLCERVRTLDPAHSGLNILIENLLKERDTQP